jgi:hypothetical protein
LGSGERIGIPVRQALEFAVALVAIVAHGKVIADCACKRLWTTTKDGQTITKNYMKRTTEETMKGTARGDCGKEEDKDDGNSEAKRRSGERWSK